VAASLSIEDAILRANHTEGIGMVGATVDAKRLVIRDGLPDSSGSFGRGIEMMPAASGLASELTLADSLVDQNRSIGLFVRGSKATVSNTIVRGTSSNENDTDGRGVDAQFEVQPANVTLERCTIDSNHEVGVFVSASNATITNAVVRDTQPSTSPTDPHGTGIVARMMDGTPSIVTMNGCLLAGNHASGINVVNSSVTLLESEISSTLPVPSGAGGHGIIVKQEAGAAASISIEATRVLSNTEAGVAIFDASADITASWFDSTKPGALAGGRGIGVAAQGNESRGVLTVRTSRISANRSAGILGAASDVTIENTTIVDTMRELETGEFGDGVISVGNANVSVRSSLIDRSARTALSAFGATLQLEETRLGCNLLELAEEVLHEGEFGHVGDPLSSTVEDGGGNVCLCDGVFSRCSVSTSTLAPPTAIAPLSIPDPSSTAGVDQAK
jgi:hypothetical protein